MWPIIEDCCRSVPNKRGELESWTQSRSLPAGDEYRARLILALADGLSYREIERKLGASAPTVSKWTEFEAKAADLIGLYLNAPQHAAVFCVDEKTAIQALDRMDPVLP